MGWFSRNKEGITTSTKDKKETPEGLWYSCPTCNEMMSAEDHAANSWVCISCQHHHRISAQQYLELFFGKKKYKEFNNQISAADPLGFVDTKKYEDRIVQTQKKHNLKDAIRTATGEINGITTVIAAMDFAFIGGSMGSVVGEKIMLAIDEAIKLKAPFMIVSKSGGARMMEAGYSLMQMAKTSAKLTELSRHKLPYVSFLTDPTTGGVTASFAMLGDLNVAEPGALIAFAGPRVVKETIGKDLPEGFQTAEFVLEHGFLDYIVPRLEAKDKIAQSLAFLLNRHGD